MDAKSPLDAVSIKPKQDATNAGVGWRPAPLQTKYFDKYLEARLDERANGSIGVGPRQRGHNREEEKVRECISLPLSAPIVLDLGKNVENRFERFHGQPLRRWLPL